MNKRSLIACALAAVFASAPLASQRTSAQELVRERLKSDFGIELLGKAALYSFNYQYTLSRQLGIEAGIGALGGGTGDDNATVAFIPIGAKLYLIPKDGSVYLTGGVTIVTAGTDSGPFDDSTSFGFIGVGFEFRAETGFTFRGTAYSLLSNDGFFIWPGLTLAYAF
ncbi:MAG: hypothetical protein PHD74_03865 [Candidatus Krumholzibacteria bacterium]|nr:hypothetical protein [Candidatus Krumholzibacteria bacterium]